MPRKAKAKRARTRSAPWKPLELYQHQQEAVDAYAEGKRRFFHAWHRRAGKDVFALDFARERMQERIGTYWHLFPFHVQAKRAIWKGIDARTGERFIDRAFPPHMRESENETEMSIQLDTGSSWQMLGSDNYDRMVGSNPCGIIFSEWALCDPAAWDYIRPILMENKGWAMFITTFRGRNHAWRMYENIKDSDGWFVSLRTVADTYRRDGTPIVSERDIAQEVKDGMDPALVQQEFYCDPSAATSGAIFIRQHARLVQLDPQAYQRNNQVIRVAWGMHDEGIAAVSFQGAHVIAVHRFVESNLLDAAQAVVRRHPHAQLIHHAIDADPSAFREVDGAGVVSSQCSTNQHVQQAAAAAALNTCSATSVARESLADFAANFAPYRQTLDETDLTYAALAQALAVMRSAQSVYRRMQPRPMNYAAYDRGVI